MNILLPHTGTISYATMVALETERYHLNDNEDRSRRGVEVHLAVDFRECVDWDAYRRGMRDKWQEGESFIVLEQDVAPWPGALTQLWECPEPWCAFPEMHTFVMNHTNLGCVKFGERFIAEHPTLWDRPIRWENLDHHLYGELRPEVHHRHLPPVLHMNYGGDKRSPVERSSQTEGPADVAPGSVL